MITGHEDGIITLNIAEADAAFRENMREKMGEAYRTVLGHLRHEIGHYYWDRLVRDSSALQGFRQLFGDDTLDYEQAVQRHYQQGPARELARFVHQRLRQHASVGRLGRDLGALPAHGRHAGDRQESRPELARADRGIAGERRFRPMPWCSVEFESLTSSWNAVTLALNSLNRSMGMKDAYPFVLSPKVLEKLRFVHELIQRQRRDESPRIQAA